MRVVFLSPGYPAEMPEFVRGLAEVGAQVIGVGEGPAAGLPEKSRKALAEYIQVPKLFDEDSLVAHLSAALRGRKVDRVESLWEPLVHAAARVREALGVPGMSADTVNGFRDKQIMKERVARAGLRVPKAARCRTAAEVRAAAAAVGFPLILKPIAGAGSADTFRCDTPAQLDEAIKKTAQVTEASCEEFIDGEEYTYDTICVNGVPVYENVCRYLPRPLVARTNEWISPAVVTVRDLSQPHIQQGMQLGRGVMRALGMGTGFTHMEWYRKPDGEVVFGEIGCRVGGARLIDQMNFTSDIDLYREWARAVCFGKVQITRPRSYNCAIIFKRAQGQGTIVAISGLRDYIHRNRDHIMVEELLRPGQRRRDWKQTLVSDGYLIVRHPTWEGALALADDAAQTIGLFAREGG
ncbi:MAG: ATP-grasp domain-containing protein [Deltaproteobacteria bacterium]|nr:ATP-grasp domain-containing protein [Deltaproteobacteria bacterium]